MHKKTVDSHHHHIMMLLPKVKAVIATTASVGLKALTKTTTTLPLPNNANANNAMMLLSSMRGGGAALTDYSDAARTYFDSIRTPAALIAGSAFAAVFVLADRTKAGESNQRSRLENQVLLVYLIFSLVALLLSLNVVITATATSNVLMIQKTAMAESVIDLLSREFEYEYLLTRWSFFISMFSFLGSITSRCLLEFNLLSRKRITSALLVLSLNGSLMLHLISFVNQRLSNCPNLFAMTTQVVKLYVDKSLHTLDPFAMGSFALVLASMGLAVAMFFRSDQISKAEPKNQK